MALGLKQIYKIKAFSTVNVEYTKSYGMNEEELNPNKPHAWGTLLKPLPS